jgi:hypothetical protein
MIDNNLQNELDKDEEEQYNDGLDGEDDEIMKEEENDKNIHENEKNSKNEEDKNIRKPGEKQKRRSKNECFGRDYKCGCGKEYLSYPALYTHIKTKHDGKTPEGTNANQIQNGKGRGRPRKNFLTNEDAIIRRKRENNRKYNENQSNELKDILNHNNCSMDYFNQGEYKFIKIYHFFDLLKTKQEEKFNLNMNDENSDENKNHINHNRKNSVSDLDDSEDLYNIIDLFNEEMINNSSGYKALYKCCKEMTNKGLKDVDKIEKKEKIKCDEAFILYLFYISKFVKKEFCKINLMVLKHFRDLINILGWNILSEYKSLNDEDTSKDFCSLKEPLKIPLMAGDFCNSYMKEVMKDFDVYFGVVIISHFNFWLYANNLTFIKLNLPNIINDRETKIKEKNEIKNNSNNEGDIIKENDINEKNGSSNI